MPLLIGELQSLLEVREAQASPGLRSAICSNSMFPEWEFFLDCSQNGTKLERMRIFNYTTIRDFWAVHPDSKEALTYWYEVTEEATWHNSMEVKLSFRSADILSSDRVVFDIKGNNFRLIASINYQYQALFVKWIGTHKEYDRVDALTIDAYGGGAK